MKTLFYTLAAAAIFQFQHAYGADDPRFTDGTKGIMNSYFVGMTDSILKAFGRADASFRSFKGINRVGGAYVISFSVALDSVKEPVTEKDFKRMDEFFEPFIQDQIKSIELKGTKITSRSNEFPLPSSAKGYSKDDLPTMVYRLSGEKDNLFYMKVTFSERRDDHLVVEVTIVTTP